MITVIGDVNVDMILKIPKFPEYDDDVPVEELKVKGGGFAANTAYALKKLGEEVSLIACVGKDANAQMALLNLKKAHVDLHVKFVPFKTGLSFSLVDKSGVRRLMTYRGANEHLSYDDSHLEILQKSDWIHVAADEKIAFEMVKRFSNTSWDPGKIQLSSSSKISIEMLEKLGILMLNSKEWELFSKRYSKELPKIKKIIVKRGEKGVTCYEHGKEKYVLSAFKVENVDSTGAGDVFNAAFLYAKIKEKMQERSALLFASACAAISIGKMGAQEGAPSKDDVFDFLKKRSIHLD